MRCQIPFTMAVIAVCLNTPSGLAAENHLLRFERQQLTPTYFSEGVAVGDINGDQHPDVVYGPYWFAGPDFTEKHEIFPAMPQPMEAYADHFFSWIYDFNSDGANDIFVVGFPGTPAYVYENPIRTQPGQQPQNNTGAWTKHQVFDWVSNESPQLANLIGDERPELVCTRDGFFGFASVDWEQPFSTWTFHPISEQVTAAKFGHGLGIGDVNGDGLLDILHPGGWFEQPRQQATQGRWLEHKVKLSSAYGGAEMYAYDVDGDGDNDIITSEAAHDFGLSWYEQIEGDADIAFKRHVIMGEHPSDNKYGVLFSELHSLRMADMDGDGLQDIVTGKTYYSHHKQSPMWDAGANVTWFRLVRGDAGVDWIPHTIANETGIGRQVCVADINADGLPDVATGGMLGANILLQRRRSVSDAEYAAAQPKLYSGPSRPAAVSAQARRGPRSPIDANGKVASAIEAEDLKATVTGGRAVAQPMGNFTADAWSGASQLWWTGAKPGDKLTLQLDALRDIEAIELALTCARDYGIVQLSIDGQALGEPIDLYNAEVVTTGLLEFKTPNLKQGKHTLEVVILGANPQAAQAYMVGLDYLRFRGQGQKFVAPEDGIKPISATGRQLNLDFESATLEDWTAVGEAFVGQPIQGDVVSARRADMRSRHLGEFWIGGFERAGDAPTGTLTSAAFRVTHRFASFYVGGGNSNKTRVELYEVGDEKPFYTVSGAQAEDLSRVIVDLQRVVDREMYIRLVDDSSGAWGHLNFDHFRLHASKPGPITPPTQQLVADEYPFQGLEADAAAAAMQVPEGFRVSVCAAEPDVRQPIAMALDDRGRTWIAEAYEYPIRAAGEKGRDRILVFEDTTGDGKFDSRKVFYEGLNLVSGLEVGFGGVWVGAAPYLMFIPDRNGDDIADGEPQILLDGWGYEDTHETLNTFTWGPDGWLYGCHGVFTHSKVGKPGVADEQRISINAGVWRYHPLRHEFEVFAHGTSNPWGVDFNDYGDAFVTACVIPHLYHIIPGARYHRQAGEHFNKNTYDDIPTIADHLHYLGANPHGGNGKSDEAGGGHAHAGAMIYLGGKWPAEFRNVLFMNNIHGQRLNTDLLIADASGYIGQHGPDFLLTGDQASQILNMRYGPDGQVTLIDWYDMQACHRREVEVHDRSNGRIFKISYGKTMPVEVDMSTLSDLALAEHCLNENDWFVRHARRQLQQRAAERKISQDAISRLVEIATTHPDDTRRLRAIWARHAVGVFDAALFDRVLHDSSPHVRAWGLRILIEQRKSDANLVRLTPAEVATLAGLAEEDDSPIVRLAIASALDKLALDQRWSVLPGLVSHREDAADHNLPLLYWYIMEPLADVDPDRGLALGMAAGQNIPLLRDFMLRRVAGSGGQAALQRLTAALEKTSDPAIQLTFLDAIGAALSGQRRATKPTGWDSISSRLSNSTNELIRLRANALGVTFGDAAAMQRMRAMAADQSAPESQRIAAVQALLAANDPELAALLVSMIDQTTPAELRQAAIRGLAQYDSSAAVAALIENYPSLGAAERQSAVATLTSRAAGATALLTEIAGGRIPANDLSAELARQIEYLGDPQLTQQLTKVWGQVRKSSDEKVKLIERARQLVARQDLPEPDLATGRAVFAKTCQRCHVLYGVGEKLGPDLTGSNRANLDYLLENIIDPSAVMANEYRQSIFLTLDGQVITGIVRGETDQAVTIQTAEATLVLPKDEIDQRKDSDLSMMPENQLAQFSEPEVRSLLAYLRSKSQTAIRATSENTSQFFNGKDLSGWTGNPSLWSVENGEIVGKSQGLKQNAFLISQMLADDFELTFDVQLVENAGNSGVQFRSRVEEDSVAGYQADIGEGWWGKLYEEHGRALLWEQSGESHVKLGQWNTYKIRAVGSRIQTWINGQPCVDLDDEAGSRQGIFALQLHSGGPTEVRFRNLRLDIKH